MVPGIRTYMTYMSRTGIWYVTIMSCYILTALNLREGEYAEKYCTAFFASAKVFSLMSMTVFWKYTLRHRFSYFS
jgi:hypothetical protein